MKAVELSKKTGEDLEKALRELQKEQFRLRMSKATGQLTKTHRMQEVRRDIARAKTFLEMKGK